MTVILSLASRSSPQPTAVTSTTRCCGLSSGESESSLVHAACFCILISCHSDALGSNPPCWFPSALAGASMNAPFETFCNALDPQDLSSHSLALLPLHRGSLESVLSPFDLSPSLAFLLTRLLSPAPGTTFLPCCVDLRPSSTTLPRPTDAPPYSSATHYRMLAVQVRTGGTHHSRPIASSSGSPLLQGSRPRPLVLASMLNSRRPCVLDVVSPSPEFHLVSSAHSANPRMLTLGISRLRSSPLHRIVVSTRSTSLDASSSLRSKPLATPSTALQMRPGLRSGRPIRWQRSGDNCSSRWPRRCLRSYLSLCSNLSLVFQFYFVSRALATPYSSV